MTKVASSKMNLLFAWTSWTFGFWWDRKRLKAWGIDLGPLAFTYCWRKK